MWFKEFFFNCLYAFLDIFSVSMEPQSILYACIGPICFILFLIGCYQIIVFMIVIIQKIPKLHKKKIKRRVPWRDE